MAATPLGPTNTPWQGAAGPRHHSRPAGCQQDAKQVLRLAPQLAARCKGEETGPSPHLRLLELPEPSQVILI